MLGKNNIAMIYQPHFKTQCMRVSTREQQGTSTNYIVVTCSPRYNGVWKYSSQNTQKYEMWKNKNLSCYCVPIVDCEFVKKLEDITTETTRNAIKKQQTEWKNMNNLKETPEWFLS